MTEQVMVSFRIPTRELEIYDAMAQARQITRTQLFKSMLEYATLAKQAQCRTTHPEVHTDHLCTSCGWSPQ